MTTNLHTDRILILDFGSQYTQLIARRVREAGVYCEILPYDIADAEVHAFAPKGIILSGGPESVTAEDTPRAPGAVFELGFRYLASAMASRPWRRSSAAWLNLPPSANTAMPRSVPVAIPGY
ncbi:hypothetical protein CCP3SC15_3310002 [Gammaproteobacteria bacterium]